MGAHLDRLATARYEDLLLALGKAGQRNTLPGSLVVKDLAHRADLALAPIHYDEVGQRQELLGSGCGGPQPARDHLGQHCVVVLACDRADAEAPVLGAIRQAVGEDDHRTDGVRALER